MSVGKQWICVFFFVKQKTAYEMRISDWSSDVCSSDLFVLDDQRLKNPDGRADYFDEMLARIRDIRASEKRFYQKVRDLFALSVDYDKSDAATQNFFATVQNLLLYAVTRQTAAELITARANPEIGRAHVCNPVTTAHLVCRLLLDKKQR